MENDIIMDELPVSLEIGDETLAQTDEVIPVAEVPCGCCGDECPVNLMPNSQITIGQYFGTIQECVTISWRYHLKTKKHHIHVTLNEFYDKALDIVDDIIEQYQGINGVIEEIFTNMISPDNQTEIEYLQNLKVFTEENKSILGDHSELISTLDEFLALIDSTIYKITAFCESNVKSFSEFCYEDYISESCDCDECDCDDNEEEE